MKTRDIGARIYPIFVVLYMKSISLPNFGGNMKNPWIAAILNFFFAGAGYIYNGKRTGLGIGLTIGAFVLTYVELQLQTAAPDLFPLMFGAVFLINTFLAKDGYQEAQMLSS